MLTLSALCRCLPAGRTPGSGPRACGCASVTMSTSASMARNIEWDMGVAMGTASGAELAEVAEVSGRLGT